MAVAAHPANASAQTVTVNLQRVLAQSREGRTISACLNTVWRPKAIALDERQTMLEYFDPGQRGHAWGLDITPEIVRLYDENYPAEP